jgi:hypothetical protein
MNKERELWRALCWLSGIEHGGKSCIFLKNVCFWKRLFRLETLGKYFLDNANDETMTKYYLFKTFMGVPTSRELPK